MLVRWNLVEGDEAALVEEAEAIGRLDVDAVVDGMVFAQVHVIQEMQTVLTLANLLDRFHPKSGTRWDRLHVVWLRRIARGSMEVATITIVVVDVQDADEQYRQLTIRVKVAQHPHQQLHTTTATTVITVTVEATNAALRMELVSVEVHTGVVVEDAIDSQQ
jgi:hypothetical protein